ncbi:hypothetical protein E5676_scaffold655G00630 [Cucumis melo var. makuwa]|uniref:Uncharacterized protein n=2 Tax=Cucumis melo TaxID=3656 RepID=A0A5D3E009_CUCMM|nr:hypothetical protein E6C27_scaffold46G00630 [Cucumis melo var. makuwa]TYK29467.1 hypothetical protein E5676_scaffold655G00630 [Cucumis melo var. makuwa]
MESKKNSTGLSVATVVVMMVVFMIATLADSTITTENVASGAVVNGGSHAFPRKNIMKNGDQNGVCLVKGKACKSHKDCPSNCACYTAGHCGDWVL